MRYGYSGKLSDFEKDQLLDWFFFHLSMEDRRRLMQELPQAYNNAMGREIVKVGILPFEQGVRHGDCE